MLFRIQIILTAFLIMKGENSIAQSYWNNSYHITNKVIVKNRGNQLTKLIVIMPLPQTNQYQDISNVRTNNGSVGDISESDDKYIRWIYGTDALAAHKKTQTSFDFDVTIHRYNFNFNKVTKEFPYDTSSNIFKQYTGISGESIDPNNKTIQLIGDAIWSHSSGYIDYARRCYEYVASHYNYIKPGKSLQKVLSNGGGDCGGFSIIYISLLRYKGIPSRPVIMVRPDGTPHVWTDFYLENYGWVPVDVTYKQGNPAGDFFGKYNGDGIVYTKGLNLLIDREDNHTYRCRILQLYDWFFYCSKRGNKMKSKFICKAEQFNN